LNPSDGERHQAAAHRESDAVGERQLVELVEAAQADGEVERDEQGQLLAERLGR
jgi:hypothetical protein